MVFISNQSTKQIVTNNGVLELCDNDCISIDYIGTMYLFTGRLCNLDLFFELSVLGTAMFFLN